MHEVAARVETIPRAEPPKGTLRFYADAALHLVDPLPYAVGKYRSRRFRATPRDLLAKSTFDLIVCDFLFPAVNLPRRLPCPAVMFTHNVESEIWRRHAETRRGRSDRVALRRAAPADAALRSGARWRASTACWRSRTPTATTFARLYPGADRPAGPRRADRRRHRILRARRRPRRVRRGLVFTGSMDWLPNEDAMLSSAATSCRSIRAEEPEATLTIVGRAPTPAVAEAAPSTRRHASPAAWTTCGRTCRTRRSTSCRSGSAAARA